MKTGQIETEIPLRKKAKVICDHCGEICDHADIQIADKVFCCEGCKMVYGIITQNGLCDYYDISKTPGVKRKSALRKDKFVFLDLPDIEARLIHFKDGEQTHVTFYLPQMHCSSCIWILERLPKLNKGVVSATVNFLKKEVTVVFNRNEVSLREVADLLAEIGYEPYISLHDMDQKEPKKNNRLKVIKIGLAGFCFGNIMLLSFPEYFSSGDMQEAVLKSTFSLINLGLSLPVFFYCASEFFVSAVKGLKQKFLNIDAPIALAILITFVRSVYEIVTQSGAGYLDSMSGIVFFMLLGRFFQDKTYQSIAFDRDYKSYFPIAVTKITSQDRTKQVPVSEVRVGDRLLIHSDEIIPADGLLFSGNANIDYSFVTGESQAVQKEMGDLVYAGGKQIGAAIEVQVVKEISQSYLTQLWNNDVFDKQNDKTKTSFVHSLSRYFTFVLFTIAAIASVYWMVHDASKKLSVLTAVLIVACPCALLLSASFTNGNMMAKMRSQGFFIKNAAVLEAFAEADTVVFDKTGTISVQQQNEVYFHGDTLSLYHQQLIRSLALQSSHPLSQIILNELPIQKKLPVNNFYEKKGFGSFAIINGTQVKFGSDVFVTGSIIPIDTSGSRVYVSVNENTLGCFVINTIYRPGLQELINALKNKYRLCVISGDNHSESQKMRGLFGDDAEILFEQKPQDKLDYIKQLQNKGRKVIMVGDGLNDAGALQQSDAGIVISDDVNNFSPACDAILVGKQFTKLKVLLDYCRKEKQIIYGSFLLSILYNIIGLSLAVQGQLLPVMAAILMPLSSISIVLYTTLMTGLLSKNIKT